MAPGLDQQATMSNFYSGFGNKFQAKLDSFTYYETAQTLIRHLVVLLEPV